MTIRATGPPTCSAASPACTSAATNSPTCWCRSFPPRRGDSYGKLITYGTAATPAPQDKIGAICKDDMRPWRTRAMGKTRPGGRIKGGSKHMSVHRRTVLTGMLGASALVAAPAILRAQGAPMKIGFLTVKTGPLASGGIQMEQGLSLYLKERNNVLAGRPVQLFTGDSGGAPAVARTKMQEFVEKENIACLIGPLATAEALAIDDYISDKQVPTLSVAAAEDMTQRKANPWFVRATSTSAQCSYAMGDYAAKELKYKRVAMIADDIAYGYELNAGFQRAFEDAGGKVVQKLWPPLNAPDYGTYIPQLNRDIDPIFMGFAGSNGLKFLGQYKGDGG